MEDAQIVKEIKFALRSLRGLQRGELPEYDEWDSLFYLLWYQPEHINLAYFLAHEILEQDKVLIQESGILEVHDFGCGALAMQFGVALAAAEIWPRGRHLPRIVIVAEDTSVAMKSIGKKLWTAFNSSINAIRRRPELNGLRKVCHEMELDEQTPSSTVRWLTVLHVAYQEIYGDVKQELNKIVSRKQPSNILVTAHPEAFRWAFSPATTGYSRVQRTISGKSLAFQGEFEETSSFRRRLFENHVENTRDALDDDEMSFVKNYLTRHPTSWVTSKSFESSVATFRRK